jgi:hypothetical protein
MRSGASLRVHQRAVRAWSWTYEEDGLSLPAARTYPRLEDAVNAAHIAYPRVPIERIEHAPPRQPTRRRDPLLLKAAVWLLLLVLITMRLRRPR